MCTPHNSSVKSPTLLRITEMTCNFKFHLIAEMMQYISVQCIWDRQPRRKLVLFSIPDQSTLPSPVCFVTMRPLVTTSLRNMTHYPADLCKETRRIRDARQWLTICTSLSQIKSSPRLHPNLHMDQPSFKVSSGKIILAFSH
jgi:hypothetical protein